MKCPNCGNEIIEGNTCQNCGADAVIFKKIKSAADKMYNNGLNEAKKGEFTQARQSLESCIAFDKLYINARNLLGLVYMEMGLVADALKQWIISSSIKKEKNPAVKYIDNLQKNPRVLEKSADSLVMYNRALKYLQQGSEDLAMIQLKKAVDFNPKFVDAYNLIALCYLNIGEYKSAEEYIKKVLSIDKSNPLALSYIKEINPGTAKKIINKTTEYIQKGEGGVARKELARNGRPFIGSAEIISFIIGAVVTSAVLVTLILPGLDEGKSQEINSLRSQIAQSSAVSNTDQNNVGDYNELLEKYKLLEEENAALKEENEIDEKLDLIEKASELLNNGDYMQAADIVAQIDSSNLLDDNLAKYNSVKENSYPKAAQYAYEQGKSMFINNQYPQAQSNLEKCLLFAENQDFVDDAIYYLGKIAESNGDIDNAKQYLNRIINEFPNSNQLKNAQNSLSNLEQ